MEKMKKIKSKSDQVILAVSHETKRKLMKIKDQSGFAYCRIVENLVDQYIKEHIQGEN